MNPKKSLFTFTIFLSITFNSLFAQFYESGQDPASINWQQIKTGNFQIIFPADFENEASRLANTLEYLYTHVVKTLHHTPKKISVVLHTNSSFSNGFVAWAPKRMELFTLPPQDLYGQDWLDQLAVHEFRHVVQIDKIRENLTPVIRFIFGQQSVGATTGLVPGWFLEGDAVNTETSLTNAGRGRAGDFIMETKSLVMEKENLYSYEKILLGSYKDYVPDRYHTGYPLVAYTRMKYGPKVFDNSLNYVARNPYVLFAFSRSLKKQTRLNDKKLYSEAYTWLKNNWNIQLKETGFENYSTWPSPSKKCYTNYRFPQAINESALMAVKSGIDRLKEFTILYKNGKEEKIHTSGLYSNDRVSYATGKLVWAEDVPDLRWSNRSYSCIKIMEISKGKVKTITRKSRYFAPSLSPDGNKIAAIEITVLNEVSLVIMDAHTGKVYDKIPGLQNFLIKDPVWSPDGNSILTILTGNKGQALYRLVLPERQWIEIIPWTYQNIALPNEGDNYIFYSSDISGTNNIMAFHKAEKKQYQVTKSKYGCFDPNFSVNDSVLYFTSYSPNGFSVNYIKFTGLNMLHPIKTKSSDSLAIASKSQENFNFQDSIIPNNKYEVTKYSKLANTFNIHSWAPFYFDYTNLELDYNQIQPGISILSQDKLGTCLSSLALVYNNESPVFKTNIQYKGLYPVINFSVDYGDINTVGPDSLNISNKLLNLSTSAYLPLNFSYSNKIAGVIPQVEWKYDNSYYNFDTDQFGKGYQFINAFLYAYHYTRLTNRDFAPRFGFTVSGKYNFKPLNGNLIGDMYYIKLRLFLPGILKHHSFQVSGGYFEQASTRYLYKSQILYPRGYSNGYPIFNLSGTFDYSLPICYPDFHISRFFYMKRIRSNFFYDIAQITSRGQEDNSKDYFYVKSNIESMGMEITTDYHAFRFLFPFTSGIGINYLPNEQFWGLYYIFRVNLTY